MQTSKRILLPALAALLLASAPSAMAGDDYSDQAASKFSRGIANVTTGWVEVFKNIRNESREHNALVGATWGTVKGGAHAVGRTTVGAVEAGTFFAPSDDIVESRYVWNDFDKETRYNLK